VNEESFGDSQAETLPDEEKVHWGKRTLILQDIFQYFGESFFLSAAVSFNWKVWYFLGLAHTAASLFP